MSEASVLSRLPLFSGLPSEDLGLLERSLRAHRYRQGEFIFHKDDPASSLFVIAHGSVRISLTSADGKELIVALLSHGDYFGELALLDGLPRSADAIASESCELLILQRDSFLGLVSQRPAAAAQMLAALSRQLRRTTDQLQEAAFLDIPSRLLRTLANLTLRQTNESTPMLKLTQLQLAALVGASRESVNKWLSNFERRGLIKRHKGGIEVLDTEALQLLSAAAEI